MATYLEIRAIANDSDLRNRVEVAVVVAAQALVDGTPTAEQTAWAQRVFANPSTWARRAMLYVLAANRGATQAQILSATDVAIQTNVDAAVGALSAGLVPGEG